MSCILCKSGRVLSMEIYVVTAYKFGNKDLNSYLVGAFFSKDKAIECASDEESRRGRKYECTIVEMKEGEPFGQIQEFKTNW